MVEHLLEENCVKTVETWSEHCGAGLVKVSAKSKPIALNRFPCLKTSFLKLSCSCFHSYTCDDSSTGLDDCEYELVDSKI
jgi:hypothetical protein